MVNKVYIKFIVMYVSIISSELAISCSDPDLW